MGIALRPPVPSVDRDVPAPPDAVWRLLADVREWPRWGPSVRRAELDGGGSELSAGAQGTVWTAVGVPLRFSITDFDPGHRWAWKVAGVTATGHEVIATPGGCRVRFDVPWWAVAYLPVCAAALAKIEALATAA
jgi:uncharacterized protein YndB with AHSA1/START domain